MGEIGEYGVAKLSEPNEYRKSQRTLKFHVLLVTRGIRHCELRESHEFSRQNIEK
jgi:hypothetical protein